MKKLTIYGMALLSSAMLACTGGKAGQVGEAGSDSLVTTTAQGSAAEGSELEAVERIGGLQTTMPPVPLYVRNSNEGGEWIVQVVYWAESEAPQVDADSGYVAMWKVQDAFCRNVKHYTKVLGGDGKLYDVTHVGEAKSSDNSYGSLASTQHPQSGQKFKIEDLKTFAKAEEDGYLNSIYWLFPDDYLNSRERLDVKTYPWDVRKPLEADVVKKLEAKYGLQAARSELTAKIGDDYVAGFVQFKPKGEKVLAVEVLLNGDQMWTLEQWGEVDPDGMSVWHVDDGGEYFGNGYEAAFVGPDGLELLFTHSSPESADFGWMTVKGNQLVQHNIGGYYVWYD